MLPIIHSFQNLLTFVAFSLILTEATCIFITMYLTQLHQTRNILAPVIIALLQFVQFTPSSLPQYHFDFALSFFYVPCSFLILEIACYEFALYLCQAL